MRVTRRAGALVLVVLGMVFGLSSAAAAAGPILDEAVSGLGDDRLFVHPSAEMADELTQGEEDKLREQLESSSRPVYLAILPAAALDEEGSEGQLMNGLASSLRLEGTLGVVYGTKFRAGS